MLIIKIEYISEENLRQIFLRYLLSFILFLLNQCSWNFTGSKGINRHVWMQILRDNGFVKNVRSENYCTKNSI